MAFKETYNISGENLLKKIKELINDGNVTKITIADKHEKEIISFPVTIGIVGLILAPIFAAVGALAAVIAECKIIVERKDAESKENNEETEQEDNPVI
ncbi:DUF4342 domain-containing protein [Sphingobacterium paucimobilis]|uniref:DUF4342 domain-containing protein n=1 Tax=Sphingobacterium paucimobilis HER1398 TaxID=1346330 RepID=U2J3C8_9SPHI|nr:DUF4342 domain-containing protein [Sphingobacterium paucimobilis]ERJ59459.1 hypothetical protein M472_11805 [Sphingobacterium paucimobilis HER1398]